MNKIMMISLSLAALSLGACNTTSTPSPAATNATNTINMTVAKIQAGVATAEAYAKKVQEKTNSICDYVPTIATVVGIVNSGYGADIGLLGSAICGAVTSIPLADGPGDHKPRVAGVVVKGTFVK